MGIIIINTLSVHERNGGIKTYLTHLVDSLTSTIDEQVILLCSEDNQPIFKQFSEDKDNVSIEIVTKDSRNPIWRIFIEQFLLPLKLTKYSKVKPILIIPSSVAVFMTRVPQIVIHQYPQAIKSIRKKMDSSQFSISLFQKIYYRLFIPFSVRKAKCNVAVSTFLCEYMLKDFPQIEPKTKVILEGVDTSWFEPGEVADRSTILFVSTLFPYKNADLLIGAYSKLPRKLKDKYSLRIVGRFPSREQEFRIKELIEKLDLGKKVILTGLVPFEKINEEYKNATIFVYPSSVETFGLPVLEAMAMGIPVISSNAMSLPEVVGDAGILFSDGDEDSLSSRLESILNDTQERKNLRKKGIEHVKKFQWKNCAIAFQDVISAIRSSNL